MKIFIIIVFFSCIIFFGLFDINIFYSDFEIIKLLKLKIKAKNIKNEDRIYAIENEIRFNCQIKNFKTKRWAIKIIDKAINDTAYMEYDNF